MRKQLMKFGSPGYAAPDPKNFPTLEKAVEMLLKALEENPPRPVTVPPAPVDSR